MEKKKQQPVNFIWKPLCLAFAALLVLSWVFFGVLCGKGGVDFSSLGKPEQNHSTHGGAVVGESTGNGIKLVSTKIAQEDYAANGISPVADTAYTLTATVTPVDAIDKTVDWSVAFMNASSAWATGKTVTDYVTVTPTSDGALTANVECLQAFGEPISVVVTSRDNSEASASCRVDYKKRVIGCNVAINGSNEITAMDVSEDGTEYVFTSHVEYGIGTIDRTGVEVSFAYRRSSDFYDYLLTNNVFKTTEMQGGNPVSGLTGSFTFTSNLNNLFKLCLSTSSSITRKNKLRNALISYDGNIFSYTVMVFDDTLDVGSSNYLFEKTVELKIGSKNFNVSVLDVELDNSSITF